MCLYLVCVCVCVCVCVGGGEEGYDEAHMRTFCLTVDIRLHFKNEFSTAKAEIIAHSHEECSQARCVHSILIVYNAFNTLELEEQSVLA